MGNLLTLTEEQQSFKLFIPRHVEAKIRKLLYSIYNTEWSGILFYTFVPDPAGEGKHIIQCEDLLPMDIGSSTFTSFEMNADIVQYMAMNDLLDAQMGLIHSHHAMDTFFSGTDMNTLQVEGNERKHFVSLIVNNDGSYNAALTWKGISTEETKRSYHADLFGTELNSEVQTTTKTDEELMYTMLKVETEDGASLDSLDMRIFELKRHFGATTHRSTLVEHIGGELRNPQNMIPVIRAVQQRNKIHTMSTAEVRFDNPLSLIPSTGDNFGGDWDEDLILRESPEENEDVENNKVIIPDDAVKLAVAQLVTLNLLATSLPGSKKNWASFVRNANLSWKKRLENAGKYSMDESVLAKFTDAVIYSVAEPLCDGNDNSDVIFSNFCSAVAAELEKYVGEIIYLDEVSDHVLELVNCPF